MTASNRAKAGLKKMFEFDLKTSDTARRYIQKVERKIGTTRAPLAKASLIMLRSVDKNFREEGRPKKWKGLSPMTIGLRRKGKKGGRPKILQDTGRLKGSIAAKIHKDHAVVGTNVKYARLHQFGGTTKAKTLKIKQHRRKITQAFGRAITPKRITVRAHDMRIGPKKIPARPFLLFQKEDIEAIQKLFVGHLTEAVKG